VYFISKAFNLPVVFEKIWEVEPWMIETENEQECAGLTDDNEEIKE
jgi:hypothetical protein